MSARIRVSVTRIAREHAELGKHLANAARTGARCGYRPEKPIPWRF